MYPVRPLFHFDDELDLPLNRHLIAQFIEAHGTRNPLRNQDFSLYPNGNPRRDLLYRKWKFLSVLIETMAKVFFIFGGEEVDDFLSSKSCTDLVNLKRDIGLKREAERNFFSRTGPS